MADTVERFHRMHEDLHTYASRDQQPILRGLRVKAVAVEEKPPLPKLSRKARGNPRVGARKAFFRGRYVATPVYDGPRLVPGQTILGPAIVEEPFTTIVVYPQQRATVDQWGNYSITLGRRTPARGGVASRGSSGNLVAAARSPGRDSARDFNRRRGGPYRSRSAAQRVLDRACGSVGRRLVPPAEAAFASRGGGLPCGPLVGDHRHGRMANISIGPSRSGPAGIRP
jgi:N-methylhydantoinase A